jgi:hypothetical protein
MKRYKVKTREIWNVTRVVEANSEGEAHDSWLEGPEVDREFVGADECEAYNTIEEIKN